MRVMRGLTSTQRLTVMVTYQPASERREPRSDMMAVLVPKDPLSSPGLVAMLDRQKVSTYGATGLTAAYIKGFKSLDGKDLNL